MCITAVPTTGSVSPNKGIYTCYIYIHSYTSDMVIYFTIRNLSLITLHHHSPDTHISYIYTGLGQALWSLSLFELKQELERA